MRLNVLPGVRNSLLALAALLVVVMFAAGCSDSEAATTGIRQVSADRAAELQAEPPADLVILDVRTPQEFAAGHLDGAVMIDFYREDFADQLATLDPDVPYLLYCRSGNRSGQTTGIMEDLGFADVSEVEGGIVSWIDAGHPLVFGS